MALRILTEASGSLTSAYLQRAIKDAGHKSIGSDIKELTSATCLSDDFILFPTVEDPNLWVIVEKLLQKNNIDVVIPTFDEMMLGWAERLEYFIKKGTSIIISEKETIEVFQDKWKTYLFFKENEIPTPRTSLNQDHPLIKPRYGRGSSGILRTEEPVDMKGMVSQEIVTGEEFTIDVYFDYEGSPTYIVPRKRLSVIGGKSVNGITAKHDLIACYIHKMAKSISFKGPINFQCFVSGDKLWFIEVNPRLGGGTALSFAATENWVSLMVENIINHHTIIPKDIKYGLRMVRYYSECFIQT